MAIPYPRGLQSPRVAVKSRTLSRKFFCCDLVVQKRYAYALRSGKTAPYFATKAPVSVDMSQPVANLGPATEAVSFVTSPTIDTSSEFFYGSADRSSGYYAERPERTRELVRYARMP